MGAIADRVGRVSLTQRQLSGPPRRAAGELLKVLEIFDQGLQVTEEGALVRVARIQPGNWTLQSGLEREQLKLACAELARAPRHGEALQLVIEACPVDPRRLLTATRRETERFAGPFAVDGAGDPVNTDPRWLLYAAMERSVLGQEGTAMVTDCYLVVPYTRHGGKLQSYLAQMKAGNLPAGQLHLSWEELAAASIDSHHHAESLLDVLRRAGMSARLLSGEELAERHYARFNPTSAAEEPHCGDACELIGMLRPREELEDAKRAAAELRERICRSHLNFTADAEISEVEHDLVKHFALKGEIQAVDTGWLYETVQEVALPWSLSVFIHGLDRNMERLRLKGRQNKDHGLESEAARKNLPANIDRQLRLQQTEELLARMASQQRTVLCNLSVYGTIRWPGPAGAPADAKRRVLQEFARLADRVSERSEARLDDGRYCQAELFETQLLLGRDVARRAKKYTNEMVGATIVPPGTRIGSPSGPPLLSSYPGSTVEPVNPFDRRHENLIAILTGAAGAGKTMLANAMIARTLASGMSWFALDRAGHYQLLCELAGGQHIDLGDDDCPYAMNPWDVQHQGRVPSAKIARLKALHRLLIGEYGQLTGEQDSYLDLAIHDAYRLAEADGQPARESHLRYALERRAEDEKDARAFETAQELSRLAERLRPYCRGGVCGRPPDQAPGSNAYLLDALTTVPEDAPMVVFDTRKVDEAIMPAVAFSLVETVRRLAERHFDRLAASEDLSAPDARERIAGRLGLAMDEMWAYLLNEATAHHVVDLGKRHRHWGLFTLVITQQLADLDSPYGKAFLDNSSMRFLGKQRNDKEVQLACELFQLSSGEQQGLAQLQMQANEARRDSRWLWLNGTVGRGVCSLALSSVEYWMFTSAPDEVALRRQTIERHDGHAWPAVLELAATQPRGLDA